MNFSFPLPPNLGNARMHWAKKRKRRIEYMLHLDVLLAAKLLHSPPDKPWPKAWVTIHWYVWNKMDRLDNMGSRFKWIGDWLESRGYIENDRHLELAELPKQTIDRKNQRVEVTMEEI